MMDTENLIKKVGEKFKTVNTEEFDIFYHDFIYSFVDSIDDSKMNPDFYSACSTELERFLGK